MSSRLCSGSTRSSGPPNKIWRIGDVIPQEYLRIGPLLKFRKTFVPGRPEVLRHPKKGGNTRHPKKPKSRWDLALLGSFRVPDQKGIGWILADLRSIGDLGFCSKAKPSFIPIRMFENSAQRGSGFGKPKAGQFGF